MFPKPIASAPCCALTIASPARSPGRSRGRLRRVLYAIGLDPSRKFGSLEEQILFVARAFRDAGSLFLPLFLTREPADSALGYREAGLDVACLDLEAFRWSRL